MQVWKSKEKKETLEWTALRGNDKLVLLKRLPPAIPLLIPDNNGQKTMKLWEVIK